MSCSHCEESVKAAVSAIPGVTGVRVNLDEKTVNVTHDAIVSVNAIKSEIEDQGYDVL
jgi:copper chaperone CopZ